MIDRFVLGTSHLYAKPSYGNLKECNKTRFGIPECSPSWCHAPFDPEGILGSLTAAVTCIIGLQFGHILVQMQARDGSNALNWALREGQTDTVEIIKKHMKGSSTSSVEEQKLVEKYMSFINPEIITL